MVTEVGFTAPPSARGDDAPEAPALAPDESQERALRAVEAGDSAVILGAPGTGKTTVLVEAAARLVAGGLPVDRLLVLSPTRDGTSRLRQRLSARLGVVSSGPLARTPASLAFGLISSTALADGRTAPTFVSGPEQDRVLRDLLSGHERGEGRPPAWPAHITAEVRGTEGFRHELRELIMRAMEWGISGLELAALGSGRRRPEWEAAARVLDEYESVLDFERDGGGYDPSSVLALGAGLLREIAGSPDSLGVSGWAPPRAVLVDDLQDFTEAGARLLDVFAELGAQICVAGDPDATTQGFRGADSALPREAASGRFAAGGRPPQTVALDTCWRQPPGLRAAVERVSTRIGVAGLGAQRRAAAPPAPAGTARPEVHVVSSTAAQSALIAHLMRRAHLEEKVPWRAMAIVARSSGSLDAIRRELVLTGIPVHADAPHRALRDEPAVRPMLVLLEVLTRHGDGFIEPEEAVELLTSRLGGADAVQLRRLRVILRAEEAAGGGGRDVGELLAEALADPLRLAGLPSVASRPARIIARMVAAGRAAGDVSVHRLLWLLWEASGLAADWRRAALTPGREQDQANADLDAMVRLFTAAEKFGEVFPGLGASSFLEHVREQAVAEDTLAPRAAAGEAVTLTTAAGSAGHEWDVVIVPGVQEGSWPNLTLRGSLLGAGDLVDVVNRRDPLAGRAARRATLDDELRTFTVAISRARRRLVLMAVRDEDNTPSPFLDLVDPPEAPGDADDGSDVRAMTTVPPALTLRGITGALRTRLLTTLASHYPDPEYSDPALSGTAEPDSGDTPGRAAASTLARLARARVPGADPGDWYGRLPLSSTAGLYADGETVPVSPSRVESFQRCGLRWFLESHGGSGPDSLGQSLGNLVHELAAEFPTADAGTLREELGKRSGEIAGRAPWEVEQQRRKAEKIVAKLGEYLTGHAGALVDVEREFSVSIGRAELRGRVDRIERADDGSLVIVDLKTGKSKPAAEEIVHHPQLGSYQAAVEAGAFEEGDVPGGAALVQLATGVKLAEQAQRPLALDEDPGWAAEMVLEVAAGMAGDTFVAKENKHCPMCPVRLSCPVQQESRLP